MMKHRNGKAFTDRRDHYQEVTDRIVAALESGTRPWRQPWENGSPGMPVNATTNRRYHGINVLLLSITSFALGGDPRFCSYKQAADRGWQVRKGERGTTVLDPSAATKLAHGSGTAEFATRSTARGARTIMARK